VAVPLRVLIDALADIVDDVLGLLVTVNKGVFV